MSEVERREMFSKEILTIDDVRKLFNCSYGDSAELIRNLKAKLKVRGQLRLEKQGVIHIADYIEAMNIPQEQMSRYVVVGKEEE